MATEPSEEELFLATLPPFLAKTRIVSFPGPLPNQPGSGHSYELLRPLTNYRSCHDGEPSEARVVFVVRRVKDDIGGLVENGEKEGTEQEEKLILKVKIQIPSPQFPDAHPGPSTTTAAELEALSIFSAAASSTATGTTSSSTQPLNVPLLLAHTTLPQPPSSSPLHSPLPGGFTTFTLMTLLPGLPLFTRFYNLPSPTRDLIISLFIPTLVEIYKLGIEPLDRGLRNILWDEDTKRVGVIDFEIWRGLDGEDVSREVGLLTAEDEGSSGKGRKEELMRWGLVRRPPARDHWAAWNEMYR